MAPDLHWEKSKHRLNYLLKVTNGRTGFKNDCFLILWSLSLFTLAWMSNVFVWINFYFRSLNAKCRQTVNLSPMAGSSSLLFPAGNSIPLWGWNKVPWASEAGPRFYGDVRVCACTPVVSGYIKLILRVWMDSGCLWGWHLYVWSHVREQQSRSSDQVPSSHRLLCPCLCRGPLGRLQKGASGWQGMDLSPAAFGPTQQNVPSQGGPEGTTLYTQWLICNL